MKILVTGGAGFIGSHVAERLIADNHEVIILDNFNDYYSPEIKRSNLEAVKERVELVEGDIRSAECVEEVFVNGNIDLVIHLAARAGVRPSVEDPELYVSTNILGTLHLLEAARKFGTKKFIFASSSSVYGLTEQVPFAESNPILQTISPYAATKVAGEQLCSNYAHLFGIEMVCLRFFTVYGPRQRPDFAISKFIRAIDRGELIEQYGDGSTVRNYTYIDDIVQGIIGALHYKESPFEVFNLAGVETVRLKELINVLEEALGKEAQIKQLPEQPGDLPLTSADISKAQQHLGYHPQTKIKEGVAKQVEWYMKLNALHV